MFLHTVFINDRPVELSPFHQAIGGEEVSVADAAMEKQQGEAVPCSAEDRRITRSKRALRLALIALIEEKGFDAITVNDLCSAADLNRGTFYNHFHDKDHLLATFEDEVMADLLAIQSQMDSLSVKDVLATCVMKRPLPFLVELFDYLRKQGSFLHAVLGPGGDAAFGQRLRDSV